MQNRKENVTARLMTTTVAGLLCAIGILIPMYAPKIVLGPASFTLASHVPIFIAIFISPPVAVAVVIGTTLGFLFSGLPLVIVLRAGAHLFFAVLGAFLLKKRPALVFAPASAFGVGLLLALVHAVSEVIVVTLFYFGNSMKQEYYTNGFFVSVVLLVGVGTIVHSMIDYTVSILVWKPLSRVVPVPASVRYLPHSHTAV